MQYQCKSSFDQNRKSGETRDCTVRAISNAFDIPYDIAHKFMKKNGREDKRGIPFRSVIGRKPRVLFGRRIAYHKTKGTLTTFIKKHPLGTYILTVTHHVFVLKDGIILDTFRPLPGKHIKEYYYISKPKTNDSTSGQQEVDNTNPICSEEKSIEVCSEQMDNPQQTSSQVY